MSTKPKMVKESYNVEKSNELIVEPGSRIALSIIRNVNGGVSVIVAEDVFKDVDDESVEKVVNCVRDTINAARNSCAAFPDDGNEVMQVNDPESEYVN
jgi:hypothetical protein